MAARRIEYKSVELKSAGRITLGRGKQTGIQAGNGVRLLRVTEDGRDDLYVSGSSVSPGTEIPWSNVASAVRLLDEKQAKGEEKA
jgi:hypothetical protein